MFQVREADRDYMATLKCSMCIQFNKKLQGLRNYNPPFVVHGSKDLQATSYKDYAATDIHKRAMLLSKKQSSSDVTE